MTQAQTKNINRTGEDDSWYLQDCADYDISSVYESFIVISKFKIKIKELLDDNHNLKKTIDKLYDKLKELTIDRKESNFWDFLDESDKFQIERTVYFVTHDEADPLAIETDNDKLPNIRNKRKIKQSKLMDKTNNDDSISEIRNITDSNKINDWKMDNPKLKETDKLVKKNNTNDKYDRKSIELQHTEKLYESDNDHHDYDSDNCEPNKIDNAVSPVSKTVTVTDSKIKSNQENDSKNVNNSKNNTVANQQCNAIAEETALCIICKEYVPSKKINFHLKEHQGLLIECDKCKRKFNLQKTFETHQCIVPLRCDAENCTKFFRTERKLISHKILVHLQIKDFECHLCKKLFARKSTLKTHMGVHSDHYPFMCEYCSRKFKLISHLRQHEQTHIGRKHKCDLCSASFIILKDLNKHIEMHTNENKLHILYCKYCNRACLGMAGLTAHILRTHRKSVAYKMNPSLKDKISEMYISEYDKNREKPEKEFKCDICGKTFARKCKLRLHLSIHTGIKPHECTECNKTFRLRTELSNHIKTHSSERTFKCEYCPDTFKLRSTYRKHYQRIHTNERPYKCQLCDKAYLQRVELKQHYRSHSIDVTGGTSNIRLEL